MTELEFLQDLQTKVLWMSEAMPTNSTDNTNMWLNIVELGPRGTAKSTKFPYIVLNRGVVAGPQFDENGDAILDAEGNQVVLDSMFAETVYPLRQIDLPVGDALTAVEYLESRKGLDWNSYEYIDGRSDLGWFKARVWVENQDGTESEKVIRVSYNDEGAPTHKVVV